MSNGINKRHLLSRPQQRQLEDWLVSVWEYIEKTKPTRERAAEDANKALGFKVTGGNVFGAARAIGKRFPFPKGTGLRKSSMRRTATLADAVMRLYQSMGETPPQALTNLWDELNGVSE